MGSKLVIVKERGRLALSFACGLVILLIISSCQAASSGSDISIASQLAPIPNISVTPKPTTVLTSTPLVVIETPTAVPTSATPASLASSTPEYPASEYQLREWNDEEAKALVESVLYWDDDQGPFPGIVHDAAILFNKERVLRAESKEQWITRAWDLARLEPELTQLPELRPDQNLFGWLVEYSLNEQGIDLKDLSDLLTTHLFNLAEISQLDNLFGDDEMAWVLIVEGYTFQLGGEVSTTVALHRENGLYRVETISPWSTYHMPFAWSGATPDSIDDLNGNGIPELIVVGSSEFGGFANESREWLDLYEWQPQEQRFKHQNIPVFAQACNEGPCQGEWSFGPPDALGRRPLTTSDYLFSTGSFSIYFTPDEVECPNLEFQHLYNWDGNQYAPEQTIIVPPNTDRPECTIAWALTVIRNTYHGWENEQAMAILVEALRDWPSVMDDEWGPASFDYFRLQTGIWLDLRGQEAEAGELLNALVNHPVQPQYALSASLAQAYLEERRLTGLGGACLRVQQRWENAFTAEFPELGMEIDLDKLLQDWGFANERWYNGVEPLCDRYYGAEIATFPFNNSRTALEQWLERLNASVLSIQTRDLKDDGAEDWLVLIDTSSYEYELWAYLNTPVGVHLRRVTTFYHDGPQNEPITLWRSFRPAPEAPLFQVVSINGYLRAFWVTPTLEIKIPVSEFDVTDFEIGDGLKITTTDFNNNKAITTYRWDAASESLVEETEVKTDDYTYFETAEQEAERLLIVEENPQATIAYINQFIAEAPPNPPTVCAQYDCSHQVNWYIPRLHYLLGIAYELNGEPDKALTTYYELWRDEPDTIFGMAASLKLGPVSK